MKFTTSLETSVPVEGTEIRVDAQVTVEVDVTQIQSVLVSGRSVPSKGRGETLYPQVDIWVAMSPEAREDLRRRLAERIEQHLRQHLVR